MQPTTIQLSLSQAKADPSIAWARLHYNVVRIRYCNMCRAKFYCINCTLVSPFNEFCFLYISSFISTCGQGCYNKFRYFLNQNLSLVVLAMVGVAASQLVLIWLTVSICKVRQLNSFVSNSQHRGNLGFNFTLLDKKNNNNH